MISANQVKNERPLENKGENTYSLLQTFMMTLEIGAISAELLR